MLVDKLIKQKIYLLDLLHESDGMTVQELREKLNLDGKTIRSRLKDLLMDCPYSKDEVSIEKRDNKYVLIKKEITNIELIKTNLKKDSLLFQVYYTIFLEKFSLPKEYSNDFFYSRSKLYTTLCLVKKCMETNGILIDKNEKSYYLKGGEMLIRFQAYHYFWGIFKGIKGLMTEESRKKLKQLLCDIEYDLGLNFSTIDSERLMSWLWISKTRVDLGKYVENKKYYEESSTDKLYNEKVKKKLTLFLNDSNETDLNHEVAFLLLILKMTLEKSLYNNRGEQGKETDIFYLGRKFSQEFRKKFDVKEDGLSISFISGEALFYHQNLDIELLNSHVERYPQSKLFNRDFGLFFLTFIVENDLKESNSEKLYVYLRSLCYEKLNLNSYKPMLRVRVSSSEGEFSEHKMKQELLKLNYNLNLEEKNLKMTDLIISDYVSREYENKFFYCTNTFTPIVITNLEKRLRKLEQNKLLSE